jgi:ribosomal protein S17
MDYPTFVAVYQFVTDGTYPMDSTYVLKKKLRRLGSKYYAHRGRLFCRKGDQELELLHEGNFEEVVCQVHNEGHLGIDNTYKNLRLRYEAPKMLNKVVEVVKNCTVCQMRAKKTHKRFEVAHPIVVPKMPFHMIGCDAVGPMDESKLGNKYILVAVDYLTKWPMAMAVPNINEVTTADFLYKQVVVNHGVPNFILTDRGSNFTSGYVQNFLKHLGCRHVTTTSYRAQVNGLCERMNQSLVQVLAKIIKDRGVEDRWDEYLDSALLAVRTMKNKSTGYSAGKLLYGYELRTPGTWPAPREDYIEEEIYDEVANRVKAIKTLTEEFRIDARNQVTKKQQAQKKRYDATVFKRPRFRVGERVLMKDQVPPSKFANRWLGPLVVVKVNENGTYWLDGPGGRRLNGAVNGDVLVPFHEKNKMIPDVQVTRAAECFKAWIDRVGG